MDNLHVCIITEAAEGGVARQLRLAAQYLPALGIRLSFILSYSRPGSRELADELTAAGFEVCHCRMGRSPNPFTDWAAYGVLRLQLRKLQPDLVHTHSFKAGFLGRRAAFDEQISSVHTPHVFAFEWLGGLRGWFSKKLEKMAARWSQGMIALTEYQVDRALRSGVARMDGVEVIPNGVDLTTFVPAGDEQRADCRERFSLLEDAFVVGVVMREGKQKNLSGLLDGLETALKQCSRMYVLLVGDSPADAAALQACGDWGKRLIFAGVVEDMQYFYQALDCYVLCSLWEGLPYSLLEAMACGVPVVASATAGSVALINDGEDGLLFDAGNSAAVAGLLCSLEADKEKRTYLASWARTKIEQHYSVEVWAQHLAGYYREICSVGV